MSDPYRDDSDWAIPKQYSKREVFFSLKYRIVLVAAILSTLLLVGSFYMNVLYYFESKDYNIKYLAHLEAIDEKRNSSELELKKIKELNEDLIEENRIIKERNSIIMQEIKKYSPTKTGSGFVFFSFLPFPIEDVENRDLSNEEFQSFTFTRSELPILFREGKKREAYIIPDVTVITVHSELPSSDEETNSIETEKFGKISILSPIKPNNMVRWKVRSSLYIVDSKTRLYIDKIFFVGNQVWFSVCISKPCS